MSCFWVASLRLFAQDRYLGGLLPQANFTLGLAPNWRLLARVESRIPFALGNFDAPLVWRPHIERLDGVVFVNWRLPKTQWSLHLGYLARYRPGGLPWVHIFLQQATWIQKAGDWRIAHRFATDQIFRGQGLPIIARLRYRLMSELPLIGNTLEAREPYFKAGNEYILRLERKRLDLEIRLPLSIGYNIDNRHRLEWGVEYRVSNFNPAPRLHQFLLTLSYFGNANIKTKPKPSREGQ